jgi:hypothetical protein
LPVFILIHDPKEKLTLWQKVEVHLIKMQSGGRWSIQIPKKNILNKAALPCFKEGVASDPSSFLRALMALDYPLMLKVRQQETFMKIIEMNHKSLSMRGAWFRFGVDDNSNSDFHVERWHPQSGIHNYMARMFPWLDYKHTEPLEDPLGAIEGETHKLKVWLNRAGEAFVDLEEFYRDGPTPKDYELPYLENDEMDDDAFDEWAFQRALEKDRD